MVNTIETNDGRRGTSCDYVRRSEWPLSAELYARAVMRFDFVFTVRTEESDIDRRRVA